MTTAQPVSFYFDPVCPWTWLSSRWLVEVAKERNFAIQWRSLSLGMLNGGYDNAPEQWRDAMLFGRDAHRMIQALLAQNRNDDVGAFYTALGTRFFSAGSSPTRSTLQAAAQEAGVDDVLNACEDASLDEPMATSTDRAVEIGGPDVGSPVIQVGERGLFGPIISPVPHGADGLKLWDALVTLNNIPGFHELKRGRAAGPALDSV